jgi:hypothetical protein
VTRVATTETALARARAVAELVQGEALEVADMCVTVADAAHPLTAAAIAQATLDELTEGEVVIPKSHDYVVVLTQTCDLQRTHAAQAHCLVAPIVIVTPDIAHDVACWKRPSLLALPWLKDGMVADLSHVTTVERSVLVGKKSMGRPRNSREEFQFAEAVARYLIRPALPDDLVLALVPFVDRVKNKHDRESDEGRVLRLVSEFRLEAYPEVEAPGAAINILMLAQEEHLPSLGQGVQLDQTKIDALVAGKLPAACKAVLAAANPVAKREALTAVAELWVAGSSAIAGQHGYGSIAIEVVNGEDISHSRARSAVVLDLNYLSDRAA